jgi:parallel beta-helix repeat protein
MTRLGILVAAAYMISGGVAHAATYYVAKTGSAAASCAQSQNAATPRLTIAAGVACLNAGDTLLVRGGTYTESLLDNVPSGTSWSSVVRIAASPGESVWMRPTSGDYVLYLSQNQQYIEFDGINMDARNNARGAPVKIEGWSGGNPHHIRIRNAELISGSDGIPNQGTDGGPIGIIATAAVPGIIGGNEFINLTMHGGGDPGDFSYSFYIQSSNNLIEGCDISDTSGAGIQIYNGYGQTVYNTIIRNNVIHDIWRSPDTRVWGIIAASGVGTKIYNNVLYNIGGTSGGAIYVFTGTATEVYNNTVYNTTTGGVVIDTGVTNSVVTNNIAYQSGTGDYLNYGTGTTASNNLFDRDPEFVNSSAGNFRLQATSPGINSGATIAMITTDLSGTARPQNGAFDIGAYEDVSGVNPPGRPAGVTILGG